MIIKHLLGEFDKETMTQHCILCGECICDYSNACWPAGQPPPQGWPAGDLYIEGKNPEMLYNDAPPTGTPVTNCTDL